MQKPDFSGCLTASIQVRVPFFDLDPTGAAWHGRYFQYFELARCRLLEEIDYSYEQMLSSGYIWPIVDTSARFIRPLRLNEEVRVTACLREWEMRLVIDYLVEDHAGALYTKARTVQVPVDAGTHEMALGSPAELTEKVCRRLGQAE